MRLPQFLNREWLDIAEHAKDPALRESILTGASSEERFVPDAHCLDAFTKLTGHSPDEPLVVLDFGCGLGRNILGILQQTRWNVIGYDSPAMLARAARWLPGRITRAGMENVERWSLCDNWQWLRARRFDGVFATLVFQHIYEAELVAYLKELRNMTKRLVVHGRRVNDDGGKNTWMIIRQLWKLAGKGNAFHFAGDDHDHDTLVWEPRS